MNRPGRISSEAKTYWLLDLGQLCDLPECKKHDVGQKGVRKEKIEIADAGCPAKKFVKKVGAEIANRQQCQELGLA